MRSKTLLLTAVVLSLCLCIALCAVGCTAGSTETVPQQSENVTETYETALFDTDQVMSVNIIMDSDMWKDFLSNAANEEYYRCSVEINGVVIENVGIRAKGNTSLTSIASDPNSDRYSLKLEFDHYVKGQTCLGLDKLILNNNYSDATNMKEALAYELFSYLGADASLYNYANVSVNGEYWGVYLALEAVEESFLERVYGDTEGDLYKPDSMDIGDNMPANGGNMPDMSSGDFQPPEGFDMSNMPDMSSGSFQPPEGFDMSNMPDMSSGNFQPPEGFDMSNMPDMSSGGKPDGFPSGGDGGDESSKPDMGGFMGGFSSGGGANLNYIDDNIDSYSTIWDGAVTKILKTDCERVIEALKNISEGNELEKYMDVDNILRYMAVHDFVVNMDSLSGSMAHNYYLYEKDGQLNIIPWDYNLSLGGMGSNASDTVNFAIDTPFPSTNFFDALLENEEYLAKYHEYLNMLVDYVNNGKLDEFIAKIRGQIDTLVETDPTAFFTYDEYNSAVETLKTVLKLRAESIAGQLDGTIPSTSAGQKADSSALIDASDVDLGSMGAMNTGKGMPGMGGGFPDGNGDDAGAEVEPEN